MRKNINYLSILFLFAVIAILIGCEKDDYTGASTVAPTNANGTITFNLPASIMETDTSYIYTVSIDPPQVVNTVIPIRIGETTTATEGEDFAFNNSITIPAFKSTGTGELVISSDCTVEENETIELVIGNSNTPNLGLQQTTKSISLSNFTTETIEIACDWGGSITVDSVEYSFCTDVDFDMYVEDSEGNTVASAATGNCPELLFSENLPNGSYSVFGLLWNNRVPQDTLIGQVINIPISLTFVKGGCGKVSNDPVTESQSIGSSASNAVFDYYDFYYYGNEFAYVKVATFTVEGENYSWTME